jgi:hypothetical protein
MDVENTFEKKQKTKNKKKRKKETEQVCEI